MKQTLEYIEKNLVPIMEYIESSMTELDAVGIGTVPEMLTRHIDRLITLYRDDRMRAPDDITKLTRDSLLPDGDSGASAACPEGDWRL